MPTSRQPTTHRGTPMRNFRCDDTTWNAITSRAHHDGTTASAVIRDAITHHLTTKPPRASH